VAATTTTDTGRPWRGQSPAERREARRARLLDAALDLFGTAGFAATSLTALCAEAGVSPRHFYELYPGREQLLADLYDGLVGELLTLVREAQEAAAQTVEEQVHASLTAVVGHLTGDLRRARVVQLEIIGVSPALEQHRHAVIAAFAGTIDDSYQRLAALGLVRERPFHLLATGLVGAVNEVLASWLLSSPRPPGQDVLPAIVEIFEAVFGQA
jgi:AcrR family transcriptional regulator